MGETFSFWILYFVPFLSEIVPPSLLLKIFAVIRLYCHIIIVIKMPIKSLMKLLLSYNLDFTRLLWYRFNFILIC